MKRPLAYISCALEKRNIQQQTEMTNYCRTVYENNGLKDFFAQILNLPQATQEKIKAKFEEIYAKRPNLAMVNSAAGITNLHVPSDVIIDASMPAMIKNGGKMWDKEGALRETKAVIPDKTYAVVYEAAIADSSHISSDSAPS